LFKFIIISFIVLYIIFKLSGYIIRALFFVASKQMENQYKQQAGQQQKKTTYRNGEIHIDYPSEKSAQKKNFKGGDYVDFEEVK